MVLVRNKLGKWSTRANINKLSYTKENWPWKEKNSPFQACVFFSIMRNRKIFGREKSRKKELILSIIFGIKYMEQYIHTVFAYEDAAIVFGTFRFFVSTCFLWRWTPVLWHNKSCFSSLLKNLHIGVEKGRCPFKLIYVWICGHWTVECKKHMLSVSEQFSCRFVWKW